MKWADWAYFRGQWRYGPKTGELRRQLSARRLTGKEYKAGYKAGLELVKQEILRRMFEEGRITQADVKNPLPPQPKKSKRPPAIGKTVPIAKAVPAHGKAHKLKHPFKYTSVFEGGLPGLGKK